MKSSARGVFLNRSNDASSGRRKVLGFMFARVVGAVLGLAVLVGQAPLQAGLPPGSVDVEFNPASFTPNWATAESVLVLTNGQILVGGSEVGFTAAGWSQTPLVVRLN